MCNALTIDPLEFGFSQGVGTLFEVYCNFDCQNINTPIQKTTNHFLLPYGWMFKSRLYL